MSIYNWYQFWYGITTANHRATTAELKACGELEKLNEQTKHLRDGQVSQRWTSIAFSVPGFEKSSGGRSRVTEVRGVLTTDKKQERGDNLMGRLIDLTGKKFGRLVVLERAENDWNKNPRWRCRCECGREVIVLGHLLRNGNTTSCGCFSRECHSALMKTRNAKGQGKQPRHITHGGSKTRLYNIWIGMKGRCYCSSKSVYKYYGERGITVCDEWRYDFAAFRDWALSHGYRDDLTIDRKDANGNYEPSNCRWITLQEQQKNRNPRKRKVKDE